MDKLKRQGDLYGADSERANPQVPTEEQANYVEVWNALLRISPEKRAQSLVDSQDAQSISNTTLQLLAASFNIDWAEVSHLKKQTKSPLAARSPITSKISQRVQRTLN